ncbi:MAG: Asp/Glu racemase [Paracoccaceae bacterium]
MDLHFDRDEGIGTRANLGVIVLQTDETLEPELAKLTAAPGVALYHNRIAMQNQVTAETLAQMEADLPISAGLFPALDFDVIGYGCTSAATVIGPDRVAAAIRQARPEAKVTDPLSAVIAACRALSIKRIGFVTPYVADVSARMRGKLEEAGFTISAFGSFNEGDDRVVARISPASIIAAIRAVNDAAPCDAVYVACTNLRVAGIAEEAEAVIGKPVLSSNLALAWHMQVLAGLSPARPGFGALFR